MKFILAIIALINIVQCQPPKEKVTSLPEMDFSGYDVYSGYIPVPKTTKQLHYLLVESANDPKNDPTIIPEIRKYGSNPKNNPHQKNISNKKQHHNKTQNNCIGPKII